jgi:uncharacterized protein YuzE
MKISYDAEVDALYIQLRELKPGQAENRDLGHGVVADFGPDGLLAGIEILDASHILGKERDRVVVELEPVHQALTR